MSEPVYVPNPYKAAIDAERTGCSADRETFRSMMTTVTDALVKAWQGGQSDAVQLELSGMKADALAIADGVQDEFDQAYNRQEDPVLEGLMAHPVAEHLRGEPWRSCSLTPMRWTGLSVG